MTSQKNYEEYAAFVEEQIRSGAYDTIPHCDSRILHRANKCEYCDRPLWQKKRWNLNIANTGCEPMAWQDPCPADAARPPGSESDHRRWGGNKPTSARGDSSWPEETFASKVMYARIPKGHWTDRDDVTVDAWRENKARQVLREMNHWDESEWSMAEFLITQLREGGVFDVVVDSLV